MHSVVAAGNFLCSKPTRPVACHPGLMILLAVFAACLSISEARCYSAETGTRPNIVVILADDLGYGDLQCYNADSKIPTPHLDRLAAEGFRATDAHSPSSVCSPTRYALLTGRYSWRSKMQQGVVSPWGAPIITPGRMTVATLLAEHGYSTACFGKWHLGWEWPTRDGKPATSGADRLSNVDFTKPLGAGPITHGFAEYFGVDLPNFPPYCYIERDHSVGIPSAPSRLEFNRPGPMIPDWQWVDVVPTVAARAVKFIEDSAAATPRRPFFFYMPLTAPHYPVVPGAVFQGRSQAGDYGDFVSQVDDCVGQVAAALARAGVADETLIIFTSDNGPEISNEVRPGVYDRAQQYKHYSMGPLRGAKRDLWEGGHRVPFVARWPGQIRPGTVCEQTICHVDLLATVAAILDANLPANAGVDSYSLLPALRGQKFEALLREATVHHSGSGQFAIRRGDWVLISAHGGDDNGPRPRGGEPDWFKAERGYPATASGAELYDLRTDLAERHNVIADHPEIVRELSELLEKYVTSGRSTPGEAQQNEVPVDPKRYAF